MALARAKPGQLFYASSGRRRAEPSGRRDLQPHGRPRHRARAVSRHRRGASRRSSPTRSAPCGGSSPASSPHIRERNAQGARGRRQGALAGAARRADGRRSRRARLRGDLVDRPAGARRHAAADDRQAVGRGERGDAGAATVQDILHAAAAPTSWSSKPDEFRQVIESDYAKYGKLADLFKTAEVTWTQSKSKPTRALAAFAANLDPAPLPDEVRQKLGWLLLDHLRVCSIGARLPWSGWARGYVDVVGQGGLLARAVLGRTAQPAARDLPQRHVRLELRCRRHPCRRDAASRRRRLVGGAGDRRARRRVRAARCWPRSWPATRPPSGSGFRCSPAISSAASRAPAPATCSARRRPPAGCCSAARTPSGGSTEAIGLAGSYSERRRAVLLFGRLRQAHPGRACGAERGRGGAADRSRASPGRPTSSKAAGGFARAYADGWDPAIIEDGLGQRFHLMDVLVKSHAAAARVAAGIDAHAGAARSSTASPATTSPAMRLGIPRIIQGRLTNPHPVDLQAAQMCLPFSVALASQDRAGAGPHARRRGRRLRGRARRSQPLRARGAHHHRARRRGRGREQRALHRRAGERRACATGARSRCSCRRRRAAPANPFTGDEHEARFTQELSSRVPDKVCAEIIAMSKDLDRLDPRWLGRVLSGGK